MKTPKGFWSVWSTVAIDLIGFGILIPLLPLYAKTYGASPAAIGLLFATYSAAQMVVSPVWGRLSDRIGRRPVLLVTIAGSAVGSLLTGMAAALPLLFVGRLIDGASGASIAVARATVADVASDADRPRLMGLLGAAFGLGFVIGPAIGGLAVFGGPAVPFFIAAGLSTLNLVATWFRVPETRPSSSPGYEGGRRRRTDRASRPGGVPSAAGLRLSVLTLVVITGFSAFETTFALLGDRRLGLTESTVAWVFAGVGLLLVVVQGGLVGRLVIRYGERLVIAAGLGLMIAGFGVMAYVDSWARLILALALLASGQGLTTPTISSAIAAAEPQETTGGALGRQQSASGLGRLLGPLMGGVLFGISIPLTYLSAGGLVGVGAVWFFSRRAEAPSVARSQ